MNVGVLGGGLQGLEAAYLLKKAGHRVLMLEKRPHAPALGLADEKFCFNLTATCQQELLDFLKKVDVIIPATENKTTLVVMNEAAKRYAKVFCFDSQAYELSSSKSLSNKLFSQLALPRPIPWPDSSFPLIVKPSEESGSRGVKIVFNQNELDKVLTEEKLYKGGFIIEEFLEGPSYSIEVVTINGEGFAFETTLLGFDELFDCNRVIAPNGLDEKSNKEMQEMALRIAQSLKLTGIMDLETILHEGKFKVLEIDARLPSQTPTVVYKATGLNLVSYLLSSFLHKDLPGVEAGAKRAVIYEHLYFCDGMVFFPGEHIITSCKENLFYMEDFFGADEAITNCVEKKEQKSWVATVIITGHNLEQARTKREYMLKRILEKYRAELFPSKNIEKTAVKGRKS
ncbi:MAG: 3-methylornithine--L-lysine ligase PylC [Dethiobacter sp.]|nr:MAG: 3-methylornithine--L-lysine ligase PylC [Dethiobacter sp.]